MDIKQLRQLSRKLMKANKSLIAMNEKLYKDKQQIERQNEQLQNEFGQKLQTLEKENETFKRLLKAEDKINSVDEILSNTTIEALKTELASQGATSSELKMAVDDEAKPSNIPECSQNENDVIQLEMVSTFSDDNCDRHLQLTVIGIIQ
jgi:DNA repair exonuclease SbcCD ATPase subunit